MDPIAGILWIRIPGLASLAHRPPWAAYARQAGRCGAQRPHTPRTAVQRGPPCCGPCAGRTPHYGAASAGGFTLGRNPAQSVRGASGGIATTAAVRLPSGLLPLRPLPAPCCGWRQSRHRCASSLAPLPWPCRRGPAAPRSAGTAAPKGAATPPGVGRCGVPRPAAGPLPGCRPPGLSGGLRLGPLSAVCGPPCVGWAALACLRASLCAPSRRPGAPLCPPPVGGPQGAAPSGVPSLVAARGRLVRPKGPPLTRRRPRFGGQERAGTLDARPPDHGRVGRRG